MPEQSPVGGQDKIGYLKLPASLPPLIVRHASLRLSAVLGAAGFAAFSTFWATLAFHLSQTPIELGPAAVGLFGLGSLPGALAARYSGRLTDRYGSDAVNVVALASAGIAFAVFLLAGDSVVALVIGCNLLGYGTTSAQIVNQARIFTGPVALRARLNTVYTFSLFASGVIGSAVGIALLEAHGWTAMICEAMGFLAVGALSLTVHAFRKHRTSGAQNSAETIGLMRRARSAAGER
ncbi:MFS transporter [Streptomyces gibsoniae]|nr:hypothetical protein [Streptomyces sp. DSM 41699]